MLGRMSGTWLSPEEQQAWRTYLRLSSLLPAHLNRQLQRDSGLTLPEYEVLVQLSEAPQQRCRPFQICAALNWEQSRLSHQLTRMQHRGLVAREECEADGRGAFVVLTATGADAIRTAAPGHVAAVRRLIFDRLDDAQRAAFEQACGAIIDALTELAPLVAAVAAAAWVMPAAVTALFTGVATARITRSGAEPRGLGRNQAGHVPGAVAGHLAGVLAAGQPGELLPQGRLRGQGRPLGRLAEVDVVRAAGSRCRLTRGSRRLHGGVRRLHPRGR